MIYREKRDTISKYFWFLFFKTTPPRNKFGYRKIGRSLSIYIKLYTSLIYSPYKNEGVSQFL